jgi:hypothetical protein
MSHHLTPVTVLVESESSVHCTELVLTEGRGVYEGC